MKTVIKIDTMKKLLLLALACLPVFANAQTVYKTLKEAEEATKEGYKTGSGWVIKPDDKIKFGKGTMPDKSFAFTYVSRSMQIWASDDMRKEYLASNYANSEVKVKKIGFIGNKKTGFSPVLVIGVGSLANYWVEIDNAIDAAEVIPPAEFSKKQAGGKSGGIGSVADELKKLKELLDAKAITQEEYNAQKKKLLNM